MRSVSSKTEESATTKKQCKIRSPVVIVRKIIAFQELMDTEHIKRSAREASQLLEIPNSTMQSWREQKCSRETPVELIEFFSTLAGANFLQRNIMVVMKLMKCGPGGIRGMREYLRNSGLDAFVASSEGALQNFWERCENCIIEFGRR